MQKGHIRYVPCIIKSCHTNFTKCYLSLDECTCQHVSAPSQVSNGCETNWAWLLQAQVFIRDVMESNKYSSGLSNEPVAFILVSISRLLESYLCSCRTENHEFPWVKLQAYLVVISPMWIAWFIYSTWFSSRKWQLVRKQELCSHGFFFPWFQRYRNVKYVKNMQSPGCFKNILSIL